MMILEGKSLHLESVVPWLERTRAGVHPGSVARPVHPRSNQCASTERGLAAIDTNGLQLRLDQTEMRARIGASSLWMRLSLPPTSSLES